MGNFLQTYFPPLIGFWMIGSATRRHRRIMAEAKPGVRPATPWPWVVAQFIGSALLAWAIWQTAKIFLDPQMEHPAMWLAGAMVVAAAIEGTTFLMRPPAEPRVRNSLVGVSSALLVLGLLAGIAIWSLHRVPTTAASAIAVACPVSGAWRVSAGGPLARINPHWNSGAEQHLSVDFRKDGDPAASLGQPVTAPVAGKVVRVVKDMLDDNTGNAEGNFVVIETPDGTQVTLAHLQEGSVAASEGQEIKAGEPIGKSGRTGSATLPHVHIHAQKGGAPVPMLFGTEGRYLIRGDEVGG